MKPRRKSPSSPKRSQKDSPAKKAVLQRWKWLLKDEIFDARITELCETYDLKDYLPIGKSAQGVSTGVWPVWMRPFEQDVRSHGNEIDEGTRPPGQDFRSRLSTVMDILKREFHLGADFDWPLQHYILWAKTPRLIPAGPTIQTIEDHYGVPHLFLEITPLTGIEDVNQLWSKVMEKQKKVFPSQHTRSRNTRKEDRLQFTQEQRAAGWSFPKIAQAWEKLTGTPTTADGLKKPYYRARPTRGR